VPKGYNQKTTECAIFIDAFDKKKKIVLDDDELTIIHDAFLANKERFKWMHEKIATNLYSHTMSAILKEEVISEYYLILLSDFLYQYLQVLLRSMEVMRGHTQLPCVDYDSYKEAYFVISRWSEKLAKLIDDKLGTLIDD